MDTVEAIKKMEEKDKISINHRREPDIEEE